MSIDSSAERTELLTDHFCHILKESYWTQESIFGWQLSYIEFFHSTVDGMYIVGGAPINEQRQWRNVKLGKNLAWAF